MRFLPNRKQKGPDQGWQLWRWLDIREGLTRLTLLRTPWFQILLHWIKAPDHDLHDHPWWFFGFVLQGSYTEVVGEPVDDTLINTRFRYQNYFVCKNSTQAHGVVAVNDAITLLITGPVKKSWSFFTPVRGQLGSGDVTVIRKNK